jgi:hypothetical protein
LWLWGATLNFPATTPPAASKLRIEHAYRNMKTDVPRPGKSWLVHFPNTTIQQSVGGPREKQRPLKERVAFLKLAGRSWVKPRATGNRARAAFAVDGPSYKNGFPTCIVDGEKVPSRISWVGNFRHVFAEMFAMHLDRVLGL